MKLIWTLFCLQLWAGTVTITWDPMPTGQTWKTVRLYEIKGGVYTQVAEVPANQNSIVLDNVEPGRHDYVARSVDGWESADSNMASTPARPDPPKVQDAKGKN